MKHQALAGLFIYPKGRDGFGLPVDERMVPVQQWMQNLNSPLQKYDHIKANSSFGRLITIAIR